MSAFDICQKKNLNKKLYFGIFDEGFHGPTRVTLHSIIDPKDFKF